MARKKTNKPARISASYTLNAKQKQDLDEINLNYKGMYKRLRSDMLDDGIAIMLRLLEKYGPAWYYANREVLVETIIKQIEKLQ